MNYIFELELMKYINIKISTIEIKSLSFKKYKNM